MSKPVVKAYLLSKSAPSRWGEGRFDHDNAIYAVARAARYLKAKGGSILHLSDDWPRATVLVKASAAAQSRAIAHVRSRGVSVKEIEYGGRTMRSAPKGRWHVGIVCPFCGTCYYTRPARGNEPDVQVGDLCKKCSKLSDLEILSMAFD